MKPILSTIFYLSVICSYAQITGTIKSYAHQPVKLYRCYGDTLFFVDSTRTNDKGEFKFNLSQSTLTKKDKTEASNSPKPHLLNETGTSILYKIVLSQENQWFYVLYNNLPVKIKTVFSASPFYNIATDSLQVIESEENKVFFEFQRLQKQIVIANTWLLEMMRLYPIYDPFHPSLVKEYMKRYHNMETFVKKTPWAKYLSAKQIAYAYYVPVNPDWKEPDPWRDSILAAHYFDYFNPADSFYLHTNILPEKLDIYITLRTNKRDKYNQPVIDPQLTINAAKEFLNRVKANEGNFRVCLSYLLKRAVKEHKDELFLALYDGYLHTEEGDCGSQYDEVFQWAREKANIYRGVQIGSTAPDFVLEVGKLNLYGLESDYTLLIFWASWCPHCTMEIPEIKKVTDSLMIHLSNKNKRMSVVAISLDNEYAAWQKYVQDNKLFTWLNTSELKGWKGEVPKRYNVYATPTMFFLDREKKIIAKPTSVWELKKVLKDLK